MPHSESALTVALAVAAGVVIQCAARSLRVPAIILLLAAGVALGPSLLGWIHPQALGQTLFMIVDFAVAVILFEGALNLELGRLRREERVIRRLVTWGALVSLAGGALAARFWLDWGWTASLLFGSLVVVTGPTVVGPLVRDLRLQPRLQTVLEAEGILIDPIGALLAILVLQITLAPDPTSGMLHQLPVLGWRLAVGIAFGAAGGAALIALLRLPRLVHGLENIVTLALVVLLFHLSEHVVPPSGLLAVTVAGLVVGNVKSPVAEDLREFKDQLTVLLIGTVFVLLAADIDLSEMASLGWAALGVLLTLILIVRPLGVWLATWRTALTTRERVFVAAIAPRGIVAAALASLTASALAADSAAGGPELRALVFVVIAGTVTFAGAAAWPLARALQLRLPRRDRVAILGAQGLGMALGRELRKAGQAVVFVDADPQRCLRAQEDGFQVVFGDALQDRTLRRLSIELVGTFVGVTFNDSLNSQTAGLAKLTFGVDRTFVSVDAVEADRVPEHVQRSRAEVLFEGAHDQERWDVRWRQGDVEIGYFVRQPQPGGEDGGEGTGWGPRQEAFVMLTHERNGRVGPMSLGVAPRDGDRAAVAIFTGARDEALRQLAALGWIPEGDAAPAAGAAAAEPEPVPTAGA